ncbi:hypothetical protein LTR66_007878 [Elasticomyces elasticus]|nr:hypothetical protein LTR66_007878 [Elasticomyces elasticus]
MEEVNGIDIPTSANDFDQSGLYNRAPSSRYSVPVGAELIDLENCDSPRPITTYLGMDRDIAGPPPYVKQEPTDVEEDMANFSSIFGTRQHESLLSLDQPSPNSQTRLVSGNMAANDYTLQADPGAERLTPPRLGSPIRLAPLSIPANVSKGNVDLGRSFLRTKNNHGDNARAQMLKARREAGFKLRAERDSNSQRESGTDMTLQNDLAEDQEKIFKKAKQVYEQKQAAGELPLREEIEFIRLRNEHRAWREKARMDQEREVEEALFEQETRQPVTSPKHKTPFKRPIIASDDDRPAHDKAKKRRKDARIAKAAHTAMVQAGLDVILAKPNKKKSKRSGKPGSPNLVNYNSLLGSDVIRDAASNAKKADPATFRLTTRRKDALKELFASVTTKDPEVNRDAGADKRLLDDSIRNFTGLRSVKTAADGCWKVDGMRCLLKPYQVIGTGFMRRRENSIDLPRGGIQADEMGLGSSFVHRRCSDMMYLTVHRNDHDAHKHRQRPPSTVEEEQNDIDCNESGPCFAV